MKKDFDKLNLVGMEIEPCVWSIHLRDAQGKPGELIGVSMVHVDDFIFSGAEEQPKWRALLDRTKSLHEWGAWDDTGFAQCGCRVRQSPPARASSTKPTMS